MINHIRFFFSSRRRHTRWPRDWSSDVCSSDLAGFPHVGIGQLITAKRVKKLIASHIGSNPNAGKQMNDKTLDIEISPQGTLVERIRAGGAGLGGILTDVGVDGLGACNKEKKELDGDVMIIERPLVADVAIIYAKKRMRMVDRKSTRLEFRHVAIS